jgi:hypothetical protein
MSVLRRISNVCIYTNARTRMSGEGMYYLNMKTETFIQKHHYI